MLKRWLLLGATLLMAVLAVAFVACGDDEDEEEEATPTTAEEIETPEATVGETPEAAASVQIVAPAEGDTVTSPVTLEVSASGVTIYPASDAVEGAAHFHAFVDQEATAEGEVMPQDTEGIFHFGTETYDLELEPGEHTVTVVLGDNTHVRLAGVPEATVAFTVE